MSHFSRLLIRGQAMSFLLKIRKVSRGCGHVKCVERFFFDFLLSFLSTRNVCKGRVRRFQGARVESTVVDAYSQRCNFIKTFPISSQAPPFVMRKDPKSSPNTTQEFEGLSIDILEELKNRLKFNYRIYLVPDGKFGVRDRSTGQWNGIVEQILNKVFPHFLKKKENKQTNKK